MALWLSRRSLRVLTVLVVSVVVMVTVHVVSWKLIPTQSELEARRRTMNRACGSTRRTGDVQGVFLNKEHKLAYCYVPKTGCTFWKRVFGFLNNDTGLSIPVHSPFDIPRLHIHLNKHAWGSSWRMARGKVQNYFRFMFSRDPYSRLWSAYLDKFYLPDFWVLFGSRIMKRRTPRPSRTAIACGSDVTFTEFVEFSLRTNEQHWKPVAMSCDPCQFKPHLLGRMDTYTRDARAVLDRAGLSWILDGMNHSKHIRNELEMLVAYNFDVIYRKAPQLSKNRCISNKSLGDRLWKTFQYNGYISDNFPYRPPVSVNRESFLKLVLDAFAKTEKFSEGSLKEQKERHMGNAFRQLHPRTLRTIASKYDMDFKIFGYSPRFLSRPT